ncbi:MAG: glycosyltransferase family 4 protein [Candidatus Eisenbacteria bacterium]|nr:glycosyltransferase family 4 protein [Candidatus Eisenbacteria bacterium]
MNDSIRPLHIAILIGRFPPGALGGAEHQAECWARRLSDRHRVTVVTRREPPAPPGTERRDGFTVMRLPLSGVPLWRAVRDLSAITRAVTALKPRPDVVLCFQTFISGYAGVRLKRRLGIPAVVWIRGEGEYRLEDSRWARWVGPRVWREADGVLVQSEENRAALLREMERFAPGTRRTVEAHLEVVPNGLDLPRADTLARRGSCVLAVGRLIRDKGMDTVIDASAGLAFPLVVAGTGPERARLEALARARGVPARFEGFVERERLATLYRESAFVVLAARKGEGLPNVLLEAMAFGRPVIATPVAGVRDLVRHEENGLLIPPDDPAALKAAFQRLIRDPELADRLAAGGRRTALEYAWEQVRPRLEAALERWAS